MIVCDYIDENVKNYLNGNKSDITILTFFKEPFDNYKGNKVIFIDDILDEEDYREIDIFVNKVMKDAEEVFSKYLEVDGYKLFDYPKYLAHQNLNKIYKFKYSIDKILKEENKKMIYYFSSELELLQWIKLEYSVKKMNKDNLGVKTKLKEWIKNNNTIVNYIFDRFFMVLFKDYQNKSGNILWMGGRLWDSKLINELEKYNKIFLLSQLNGGKLGFAKRKYKFDLLKQKNNWNFNKKCDFLINQYEKGLRKIAFITGINIKLLEIFLKINQKVIKDLLITLFILEDNKDTVDLLIVEQSVIGRQALAVDFFYQNKILSIEILHGIPGVVAVGKTSKIAVYGQRDKLFLSSRGVNESKIEILGCPYYDRIFKIKKEEKKYKFLLLVLTWIHYLPSLNSHEKIFRMVDIMLKLLQKFQHEKLIIKLHPGQSKKEVEYIKHLVKNIIHIKNRVEVVKDVDTISLLKDAKIVYNYRSCVGVEALLMKKPSIILDLFAVRGTIEYEKYDGCFVAKNYNDLAFYTERILKDVHEYLKKNNENIERTRRYFSGDLKGESYKKVAKLINEMLSK